MKSTRLIFSSLCLIAAIIVSLPAIAIDGGPDAGADGGVTGPMTDCIPGILEDGAEGAYWDEAGGGITMAAWHDQKNFADSTIMFRIDTWSLLVEPGTYPIDEAMEDNNCKTTGSLFCIVGMVTNDTGFEDFYFPIAGSGQLVIEEVTYGAEGIGTTFKGSVDATMRQIEFDAGDPPWPPLEGGCQGTIEWTWDHTIEDLAETDTDTGTSDVDTDTDSDTDSDADSDTDSDSDTDTDDPGENDDTEDDGCGCNTVGQSATTPNLIRLLIDLLS